MSRFYADASVTASIVRNLRSRNVTIVYGLEIDHAAQDEAVLADAVRRQLVLITEDNDFGELIFRRGLAARGVILIRRSVVSIEDAASVADQVLAAEAGGAGLFIVISETGVRSRPLPASRASPPSSDN